MPMRAKFSVGAATAIAGALAAALVVAVPAWAHHSFAQYNMEQTKLFTGVVTRVNPDANHLQIFFAPMNEERKNVLRDADGTAQPAQECVSVNSFPPGTIFSVGLHPLRSGGPAVSRVNPGGLFKCP